jgi:hypothetical protein
MTTGKIIKVLLNAGDINYQIRSVAFVNIINLVIPSLER